MRVRAAAPDDVDVLVELIGLARELVPARGRAVSRRWPDGARNDCLRLLEDPDHRVVVAVDEVGDVLGAAVLRADTAGGLLDPPSVYVSHLLVDPAQRRRGAGRALVAAAAAYAEDLGVDSVTVGVAPAGRDANRFFARLGFAPLVIRRIAPVAALRRALATTDPTAVLPLRPGRVRALHRMRRTG